VVKIILRKKRAQRGTIMGLLSWLWSKSAPEQVQEVERQAPSFEERLTRIVQKSQSLSSRTQEERQALIEEVSEALDIVEAAIGALEAAELADRAKRTRTRLRAIRTRAERAA
jgi:molecular chaperone GrpE (heat shock protein)